MLISLRTLVILLLAPLTMIVAAITFGLVSTNVVRAKYPERQITMLVCFAAAGGTDIAARLVSTPLSQALGKAA